MNEELTKFNLNLYNQNPQLFTDEQVVQLEQAALSHNISFQRNHEADDFNFANTVGQMMAGIVQGATTMPIDEWLDYKPRNTVEEISHSIGSLMGFVGALVGPGILGKLGLGAAFKSMNMLGAATKLSKMPTMIKIPSLPMYLADKAMLSFGNKSAEATAKFLNFVGSKALAPEFAAKLSPVVSDMTQGAFHLGIASAIGAAPIYDITPSTFLQERLPAAGHGALYGLGNRFIGNLVGREGIIDLTEGRTGKTIAELANLSKSNPQLAADLYSKADKAHKVIRGLSSAIAFGLPSTLSHQPLELQVYEYLINGYFGAGEITHNQRKAQEIMKPYAEGKEGKSPFMLLDPERFVDGFNDLDPKVKNELIYEANIRLGGSLNNANNDAEIISKAEQNVYEVVNEAMADERVKSEELFKQGKITAQQLEDAKIAFHIKKAALEILPEEAESPEVLEKINKKGLDNYLDEASREHTEKLHQEQINKMQAIFQKSGKVALDINMSEANQQLFVDIQNEYVNNGLTRYKDTFSRTANAIASIGAEGKTADEYFTSVFQNEKKLMEIAKRYLVADKANKSLAGFKADVEKELNYDFTTNSEVNKRLNNLYFKMYNAAPRLQMMFTMPDGKSGELIEAPEIGVDGSKNNVSYEPRSILDDLTGNTTRELSKVLVEVTIKDGKKIKKEVDIYDAISDPDNDLTMRKFIVSAFRKGKAFFAGKKMDGNLALVDLQIKDSDVPDLLKIVNQEELQASRDEWREEQINELVDAAMKESKLKGKDAKKEREELRNKYKSSHKTEDLDIHDKLFLNNIEILRKFNFPHLSAEEGYKAMTSGGHFVLNPTALNKRMQLFMAHEARVIPSEFLEANPGLNPKARAIILNAVNKDGSFHGGFDENFFYLVKDENGEYKVSSTKLPQTAPTYVDISSSRKQSPYFKKDLEKFKFANKLIAIGKENSSSKAYAETQKDTGKLNNTEYSPDDVVGVSINGGDIAYANADFKAIKPFLDAAIKAKSTFVADNATDMNREYNTGERLLNKYLTDNGYIHKDNYYIHFELLKDDPKPIEDIQEITYKHYDFIEKIPDEVLPIDPFYELKAFSELGEKRLEEINDWAEQNNAQAFSLNTDTLLNDPESEKAMSEYLSIFNEYRRRKAKENASQTQPEPQGETFEQKLDKYVSGLKGRFVKPVNSKIPKSQPTPGTKQVKSEAHLDGGVFVRKSVYQAMMKMAGLDTASGSAKGTQITKGGLDNLGGFLGKYAYHIADDKMDAWMEANGYDFIHFDTTAKQRGNRKSSDFWMVDDPTTGGRTVKTADDLQVYEFDWSDFSLTDSEHNDNDSATTQVKQFGDNIQDYKVAQKYKAWILKNAIEGDEDEHALLREYYNASGKEAAEIADKIDIRLLGLKKVAEILSGTSKDLLKNKVILKILGDDNPGTMREFQDNVYSKEAMDIITAMLTSKGSADKILSSVPELTPATLQIPGLKNYWESALIRYFVTNTVTPKTRYAAKAVIRPHSPFSFDSPWEEGTYKFSKGRRAQVIRDHKGRKTTLGEYWDKWENHLKKVLTAREEANGGEVWLTETEKRMLEVLDNAVVRVPADSKSAIRKLRFNGFVEDQNGLGIFVSPNDMTNMGGADTDIDTSFIYFDAPKEVKDYYYNYRDLWKNKADNTLIPGKSMLKELTTEDQPKLNRFSPLTMMKINKMAVEGNNMLGPSLSFANKFRALLMYADNNPQLKDQVNGEKTLYLYDLISSDDISKMTLQSYYQKGGQNITETFDDGSTREIADKESDLWKKTYLEVLRNVQRKKVGKLTTFKSEINRDGLDQWYQLVRDVINFAADSADGIQIKNIFEIKKVLTDYFLKNQNVFSFDPKAAYKRYLATGGKEMIDGNEFGVWKSNQPEKLSEEMFERFRKLNIQNLLDENNKVFKVVGRMNKMFNNEMGRDINGRVIRFTFPQLVYEAQKIQREFGDADFQTLASYQMVKEIANLDIKNINNRWAATEGVVNVLRIFDKAFYQRRSEKNKAIDFERFAKLSKNALGRPFALNAERRDIQIKTWERNHSYYLEQGGEEYFNIMRQAFINDINRNDMLDVASVVNVIEAYNKLVGYKATPEDEFGFTNTDGVEDGKDLAMITHDIASNIVMMLKSINPKRLEGQTGEDNEKAFGIYVDYKDGKVKYEEGRKTTKDELHAYINAIFNGVSSLDSSILENLWKVQDNPELTRKVRQDLTEEQKDYLEILLLSNVKPKQSLDFSVANPDYKALDTFNRELSSKYKISLESPWVTKSVLEALAEKSDNPGKIIKDVDELTRLLKAVRQFSTNYYESNSSSEFVNKPYISRKTIAKWVSTFNAVADATFTNFGDDFDTEMLKSKQIADARTLEELNAAVQAPDMNMSEKINGKVSKVNEQILTLQESFQTRLEEAKNNISNPDSVLREITDLGIKLKEILKGNPHLISNLEDRFTAFTEWLHGIPKDFTMLTIQDYKAFVETLSELTQPGDKGLILKKRHYFFMPEWLSELHQKHDQRTSVEIVKPIYNARSGKIQIKELEVPMSYGKQFTELSHQLQSSHEELLAKEKLRQANSALSALFNAFKDDEARDAAWRLAMANRELPLGVNRFGIAGPEDTPDITIEPERIFKELKPATTKEQKEKNTQIIQSIIDGMHQDGKRNLDVNNSLGKGNNRLTIKVGFDKVKFENMLEKSGLDDWTKKLVEFSFEDIFANAYAKRHSEAVKNAEKFMGKDFNITGGNGTKTYKFEKLVEMFQEGATQEFVNVYYKNILGAYVENGEMITDWNKILNHHLKDYIMEIGVEDYVDADTAEIVYRKMNWLDVDRLLKDLNKRALNKKDIDMYGINIKNFITHIIAYEKKPIYFKEWVTEETPDGSKKKKLVTNEIVLSEKTIEEKKEILTKLFAAKRLKSDVESDRANDKRDDGYSNFYYEYPFAKEMSYEPIEFLDDELRTYFPHVGMSSAEVTKIARRKVYEAQTEEERASVLVKFNRAAEGDFFGDLSVGPEDILGLFEGNNMKDFAKFNRGRESRNLKSRDVFPMEGWRSDFRVLEEYMSGIVKDYYNGLQAVMLSKTVDNMRDVMLNADKSTYGIANAQYWEGFYRLQARSILGYSSNYPKEWIDDPGYKLKGNLHYYLSDDYFARNKTILDKWFGINETMREKHPLRVFKSKNNEDIIKYLKSKFNDTDIELYRKYNYREAFFKMKQEDKESELDKLNYKGSVKEYAKKITREMYQYGREAGYDDGMISHKISSMLKEYDKLSIDAKTEYKVGPDGGFVMSDVYERTRGDLVARKLSALSNLEAKWNLMSLLAHPKTGIVNLVGSFQNTIVSAGFSHFKNALNLKKMQEINSQWKSKAEVEAAIDSVGGLEDYFKHEIALSQKFNSVDAKKFAQRVMNALKDNPGLEDAKIYEIAKQEGVSREFVDKAAYFMKKTERIARRTAWLAHYFKAREIFDASKHQFEWDDPWLIQMANRGVAGTQFLYYAAAKPEFMRTSLGKIFGRFQTFALGSIEFRRNILKQAMLSGNSKNEATERMGRMIAADMFMLGMASAFPMSLFNSAIAPPLNYVQGFAQFLLGDKKERERAFFGVLPYPANIIQPIMPTFSRVPLSLIGLMITGDLEKFASYQVWSWFPFGRLYNDINKTIDNPTFFSERLFGIPNVSLTRKLITARNEQMKKEMVNDDMVTQEELDAVKEEKLKKKLAKEQ